MNLVTRVIRKARAMRGERLKLSYRAKANDGINANPRLRAVIDAANQATETTGVSPQDYFFLYSFVKAHRPRIVLECGTGRTTWVISQALKEVAEDDPSFQPRLVSMEHNPDWYAKAVETFPHSDYAFTEIRLSEDMEWSLGLLRGMCYRDVPDLPYDFVFVDGPGERDMGNIDLIRIAARSDQKLRAAVDSRKLSVIAYSLAFGPDKVRYYTHWGLGIVDPVNRHDLKIGFESRKKNEILKAGLLSRFVQMSDGDPTVIETR